jgi:hypothetical protein
VDWLKIGFSNGVLVKDSESGRVPAGRGFIAIPTWMWVSPWGCILGLISALGSVFVFQQWMGFGELCIMETKMVVGDEGCGGFLTKMVLVNHNIL